MQTVKNSTQTTTPPAVSMQGAEHLHQWLDTEQISLAFTTYQTNRLFLVGRKDVCAPVEGEMIGLAVAESWQEGEARHVDLLSMYVAPVYCHQPIEKQLNRHLQQTVDHDHATPSGPCSETH